MRPPQYREGPGFIEYLLVAIIAILFLLILSKLFGPAISSFVQNFLESV